MISTIKCLWTLRVLFCICDIFAMVLTFDFWAFIVLFIYSVTYYSAKKQHYKFNKLYALGWCAKGKRDILEISLLQDLVSLCSNIPCILFGSLKSSLIYTNTKFFHVPLDITELTLILKWMPFRLVNIVGFPTVYNIDLVLRNVFF